MKRLMMLSIVFLLIGCHKHAEEEVIRKEYRIAVVLPTRGEIGEYWKKSINWSLENLNKVLIPEQKIKITAEWFDEERTEQELKRMFNQLANRQDISAIIGPLYSANAKIAAGECSQTGKLLIPATLSSETLVRQYSGKGFLWCLSENNISQCEILLTQAKQKGAKRVTLLTSDDEYGQTFLEWFSFQADELSLVLNSVEVYNADNVTEKMSALLNFHNESSHCLICVPNTADIARKMNECRRNQPNGESRILFSDMAFITPKDATFDKMEGISQCPDPDSGFAAAYEEKYGEAPGYGSAQFYDAAALAGLAIFHADLTGTDINSSMKQIASGENGEINICSETGIRYAIYCLLSGKTPHITGASGKLNFHQTLYTTVLHSVYCHWQVNGGKHQILEYTTSDPSKRNDASNNWNWKITSKQDFPGDFPVYTPKDKLYALIVVPSSGWSNYRHQANAYAIYQILKRNGVTDDHILLIAEDDIAWNPKNPKPGFIQSTTGDENLYENVKVDYRPSELPFEKLTNVVTAQFSDPSITSAHQLFVYWAGNGDRQGPRWGDKVIPPSQVADFFQALYKTRSYIKAFVAMDTDYAGIVGKACYDKKVPYLLCMTAGKEGETSKPSMTDASGNVWISNSFSQNLIQTLASMDDKLTFYDLYNKVYPKTIGSHVSVYYDSWQYGDLRLSYVKDFFYP